MSRPVLNTFGPAFAALAAVMFSANDVVIKFLSGDYALHEIVLIRSIVGLGVVLCLMVPLSGGLHLLRTKRLGLHIIRALCVVFANLTFFLGLAALPLAECVAIFFISPFLITIFSRIFLKEPVGPRRWSAIALGLCGTAIIQRPGTEAFQPASLYPMAAAFGYASLHILTRHMRDTENAVSMTFYIQAVFICITILLGLTIGDGKFAEQSDPSLAFLFRPWIWPAWVDLPFMVMLGVFASGGGYFISQAYRLSEAAIIAPFEYLALPLGIFWGILVFDEWPDQIAWMGMLLIALSGLYTIWRENQLRRRADRTAARLG